MSFRRLRTSRQCHRIRQKSVVSLILSDHVDGAPSCTTSSDPHPSHPTTQFSPHIPSRRQPVTPKPAAPVFASLRLYALRHCPPPPLILPARLSMTPLPHPSTALSEGLPIYTHKNQHSAEAFSVVSVSGTPRLQPTCGCRMHDDNRHCVYHISDPPSEWGAEQSFSHETM